MTKRLIKWLYSTLSIKHKAQLYAELQWPDYDDLLDEEWRERERLFG